MFHLDTIQKLQKMTMADLRENAKDREETLKSLEYTVVVMWEHKYAERMKSHANFWIFCNKIAFYSYPKQKILYSVNA